MKSLSRIFLMSFLCAITYTAFGQNAEALLTKLANKYGAVPNYKVNVVYETVNDDMGFSNTQEGTLVVKGDMYILKYGPNETWLNDGKVEYVGTKEEDHSQIMYFCPGNNLEAIVDYGHLLTFFSSGHTASLADNELKLVPDSEKPYKELYVTTDGDNIASIKAIDEMGTAHIFNISNFSTSVAGTQFTINKAEYAETIDERKGCK